jgi:drug/metabolite transporter (DMT)-like permease
MPLSVPVPAFFSSSVSLMPWYLYAIGCAIAFTVVSLFEKKLLVRVPSQELTMSSAVVNTVLTIPVFFLVPMAGFRLTTLAFLFFCDDACGPSQFFRDEGVSPS